MQTILRQLQIIAEMQRRMVPQTLPQPQGWHLAAYYSVAQWPGGDFYDVLQLPDGRLLLVIADASGHGGHSAVLVALVRGVLHCCPLSCGHPRLPYCPIPEPVVRPPQLILEQLNRVVFDNSLPDQFVTAFCVLLDPFHGSLDFANAGHPFPRWYCSTTRTFRKVEEVSNSPLGLDPFVNFDPGHIDPAPGDFLVFYTDGMVEAFNSAGEMFGLQRLDQAIRGAAASGGEAVLQAVLAQFHEFLAGKEPEDDVTLLVVERTGGPVAENQRQPLSIVSPNMVDASGGSPG